MYAGLSEDEREEAIDNVKSYPSVDTQKRPLMYT